MSPREEAQLRVPAGSSGWKCAVPACTYMSRYFFLECRAFRRLDVDSHGRLVLSQKLRVLCFGKGYNAVYCPKKAFRGVDQFAQSVIVTEGHSWASLNQNLTLLNVNR
jgi:hypothetical protein